jgi:hypothetical protein
LEWQNHSSGAVNVVVFRRTLINPERLNQPSSANTPGGSPDAAVPETSTGNYLELAQLSASAASFTDTGVQLGMRYEYVVRARNSAGVSGTSNPALVVVPEAEP